MERRKRILSFLMALVLCCSLLPFGVFAAEEEPAAEEIVLEDESEETSEAEEVSASAQIIEAEESTESEEITESEETTEPEAISIEAESEESAETSEETAKDGDNIYQSGSCDNFTWKLYNDGTLIISGTGEITSYPWTNNRNIRRVLKYAVIQEGITGIGAGAFCSCYQLVSVTIPTSVTSIGKKAFSCCTRLTDVNIPSSVTSIGESTFYHCYRLDGITIPNSVTSLGKKAFKGCSSLTEITLSNRITVLPERLFEECRSLTQITIPGSVTEIRDYVFQNCSSLTKIKIPGSVATIGKNAFCNCTSLASATLCEGIATIQDCAFANCTALTSITIPNSVAWLCDSSFSGCSELSKVTIGSGLKEIDSRVFEGCSSLAEITIPDNILYIQMYAFSQCTGLSKITFGSGITDIGTHAFENCTSLRSVNFPNNVGYISDYAFYHCSNLASVTFGTGLIKISDYAFSGCAMTKLYLPESLTTIGFNAFCDCSSLASIQVSSDNINFASADGILYNADKTQLLYCPEGKSGYVSIPNTVTFIASQAFIDCSGITAIGLPTSVKQIDESAFYGCKNLSDVYYRGSKTEWDSILIDGYNYNPCPTNHNSPLTDAVIHYGGYAVIYNANGGKGAPANQAKAYGKTLTLSSTKPTRTGYDFVGWATSKTATTATYKAGGSYKKNASVTLYAVWKAKTYTVKYYANGGTGAPASGTKTYGKSYTIPTTKPTRSGYTFLGWATSKTATTAKYKPGKSYSSLGSLTLYAVWKAKTYTVTYNANGGTGAPASGTKTYGKAYTIPTKAPTRSGYTFLGWATTKSATTAKYKPGKSYTTLDSFSLYAVWQKK